MTKNKLQHSNKDNVKSMDGMRDILERTLELCRRYGATDADVDLSCEQGFDVEVRMGDVESLSFHQKQGLSVEVYHGHRKGLASSTDFSDQALDTVVRAACEMAKISTEDPCYGLAPESYWQGVKTKDLNLCHSWDITTKEAIEMAIELEAGGRACDTRIINSDGSSVSSFLFTHARMNSRGFFEYLNSSRHGMSCSLVAKQGDDMQTDYAFSTARHPKDLDKIHDLATLAAERVCKRLGGQGLPTQTLPVIFSNRVSAGLIGSLMSAISGAQLYRKNSFLTGALGQKIGPDFFHLQEHPFIPGALGSAYFDADTIPTRENCFVDQGILQQYALGLYSARRLGMEPSGNADGTHNLMVTANAANLDELLLGMGRGLLVTELMGQGINILTGDYSRGASGFWVENGQIQYPVEGITIAGNLKDMFQNIVAVGADIEKNYATRCGSIWIRQMTVAGR
jgi:PmbA protein